MVKKIEKGFYKLSTFTNKYSSLKTNWLFSGPVCEFLYIDMNEYNLRYIHFVFFRPKVKRMEVTHEYQSGEPAVDL